VLSPRRTSAAGRESRDECEVNSESESVVEEEPELAVAFACGRLVESGKKAARFGVGVCDGAPLFGVAR
jgi:hypothetical protein